MSYESGPTMEDYIQHSLSVFPPFKTSNDSSFNNYSSSKPLRPTILLKGLDCRNTMSGSGVEKRGSGATVRACDSCRRRKRKCVWSPGGERCTPCIASKDDCATTHIRKPRAKSMKRTNRIAEYETRIQRLESLLSEQTAAQPIVSSQPLQFGDLQTSLPLSDWVSNLNNTITSWPLEEGPHLGPPAFDTGYEGFLDDFDTGFQINPEFDDSSIAYTTSPEESITIPHSHHSSEFLTDSSTYTNESGLLATTTTNPQLYPIHPTPTWPHTTSHPQLSPNPNPDPPTQSRTPITHIQPSDPPHRAICDGYLPPPSHGTSLLKEFLLDFNTAIPLFQPYSLASHLRICYAGASDGTVISWSSAYIVFGLAHRLRAMGTGASRTDNEQADYYMRRVINNVSELLMDRPSLGGVQCLLGLAYLIQSSSQPGPTPYAAFVSTALRMAVELSYTMTTSSSPAPSSPSYPSHPDSPNPTSNPTTTTPAPESPHEYKTNLTRTLWLSFILTTESSLLSPFPTSSSFSPHALLLAKSPIPVSNPPDSAGTMTAAEGTWSVNVFALHADLSVLQSELLSLITSSFPSGSSLSSANGVGLGGGELDTIKSKLATWRATNDVFTLSPSELTQLLYRSDMIHLVRLEASYFAVLWRIYALESSLSSSSSSLRASNGSGVGSDAFSTASLRKMMAFTTHTQQTISRDVYMAARRFIALIVSANIGVGGDYGVYWAIKLPLIAALITLLSYSYSHLHSHTSSTTSEVEFENPGDDEEAYITNMLTLVATLATKSNDPELNDAKDICYELFERRRNRVVVSRI